MSLYKQPELLLLTHSIVIFDASTMAWASDNYSESLSFESDIESENNKENISPDIEEISVTINIDSNAKRLKQEEIGNISYFLPICGYFFKHV